MNKKISVSLVLILFLLISAMAPSLSLRASASPLIPSGTATIAGSELPGIIGTPITNIRFALWNGSVWLELPFNITQSNVQESFTSMANGTTVTSTVSTHLTTISAGDVFTVQIPAIQGVNASAGQWWSMALDLGLCNRESIQVQDSAGSSLIIFVYYEPTGSCLAPNYGSDISPLISGAPLDLPSNQTQSNQTSSATSSVATTPDSAASFYVVSYSATQIAKPASTINDPPIYSLQNIMEQNFQNTGTNYLPTDQFFLPWQNTTTTGVILQLQWVNYGDPWSRNLYVDINGYQVYSTIVSGNGTAQVNLPSTDLIWWATNASGGWQYNTGSVEVSTYVGYWTVEANIYVVYTASQNFINSQECWANPNGYTIYANTQNTINFATALPSGLVDQSGADILSITATPTNDNYARYLDLYINNNFVNQWVIQGTTSEQFDITPYVIGQQNVLIGWQLYCGVGTWNVQGNITSLDRSAVAPDSSSFWTDPNTVYTACTNSGSLYYTEQNGPEYLAGTYSTETETTGFSTSNGPSTPTFLIALIAVPSPSTNYPLPSTQWYITSLETQISVWNQAGTAVETQDTFPNIANLVAGSGGAYLDAPQASVNEGTDLLTLASLAAGPVSSIASAALGVAAFITAYNNAGTNPSVGPENRDLAYQIYTNSNQNSGPFSMLMKCTANLVGPPAGWYTIKITTTVSFYCPYYGDWVTQLTFSNSFQYYLS